MQSIFKLYWQLCRLRVGPEDMPWSRELLVITLLANLFLSVLVTSLQDKSNLGQTLILQLSSLASLLVFTGLLLQFKKMTNRYVQTVTALLGAQLMIGLFSSPLFLFELSTLEGEVALWVQSLFFMLLCWELGVMGFIYHRALNAGPGLSVCIALVVLLMGYMIGLSLMPEGWLPTTEMAVDPATKTE